MSERRTWVLTDTSSDVWIDNLHLGPAELGCPGHIRKETLRGGLRDGVDVVEVDNGRLAFTVIPTRGMGLWNARCGDLNLGWQAPLRGPVHPKFVNVTENGGLGWLRGFDELMVRCGLSWNGAPGRDLVPNNAGSPTPMDLTLHGPIANLPAHLVEAAVHPGKPETLAVSGCVDEAALYSSKLRLESTVLTQVNSTAITMRDRIVNRGDTEEEVELLYHCNFGLPLLEKGARVRVPAFERGAFNAHALKDLAQWDTYRAPTPGLAEQCYWHRPAGDAKGNSLAVLHNEAAMRGVAVRFNVAQLPWFTLWKCTSGANDAYVTGLEPGTDLPFPRAYERRHGRLLRLKPGDAHQATVTIEALCDRQAVAAAVAEVERLQPAGVKVHADLQRGFSPSLDGGT